MRCAARMHVMKTVTKLLGELREGNRGALAELYPLIYDELQALAHRQRRRWLGDLTLNTTALVHEAYLKLADQDELRANDRPHFYAIAVKAMRHILCNYARDRRTEKRGGAAQRVLLEELDSLPAGGVFTAEHAAVLLGVDEALTKLESEDSRLSAVVECRFFGSMSIEETAYALNASPATVKRRWSAARAWLFRELQGPPM